MNLKGVHLLLTFRCDVECDHCFVWGSPNAKGTFTFKQVNEILTEIRKIGSVSYVSVEGGEPFLYYPIMVKTVNRGVKLGLHVEVFRIVTGLRLWKTPLNGFCQLLKQKMWN